MKLTSVLKKKTNKLEDAAVAVHNDILMHGNRWLCLLVLRQDSVSIRCLIQSIDSEDVEHR